MLEATDGSEALAIARAESPSLLLIDPRMPGLDGLATVRLPREDEVTRALPVIVLTGSASADSIRRAAVEQLGAKAILEKPFSARDLIACVVRGLSTTPTGGTS